MSAAPTQILETALYVDDLDAAEAFYGQVLGLESIGRLANRHVFFRCGAGVLLIFNPEETVALYQQDQLPVPPHGTHGQGHLCFRATADELDAWAERLTATGIGIGIGIESIVEWPGGGRSIYFRDPAGNSLEFAEARIWGLS